MSQPLRVTLLQGILPVGGTKTRLHNTDNCFYSKIN